SPNTNYFHNAFINLRMARVKLKFPTKDLLFTTKIPVRITDLNYGNHLGNDQLIAIVHESRAQWLRHHHYSELDIGGCGLIMADLMVAYKSEGRYGDVLNIDIFADELSLVSFDLLYRIQAEFQGESRLLAEAKTGMVCYDYQAGKACSMPPSIKDLLLGGKYYKEE